MRVDVSDGFARNLGGIGGLSSALRQTRIDTVNSTWQIWSRVLACLDITNETTVIRRALYSVMAFRSRGVLLAVISVFLAYQVAAVVLEKNNVSVGQLTPGEIEEKLQVILFISIETLQSIPIACGSWL